MESALRRLGWFAGEVARRATTSHPAPDPRIVALLGLFALVIVSWRPTWAPVRMVATVLHEAGHALLAVATGRRLTSIRLHSDTSGLTVSRGRPRGLGMILTLAAGYPAPAIIGLAMAWLSALGYSIAVLWLLVALCVAMSIMVRNLFGLVVLIVLGGGVGVLTWYAPTAWLAILSYLGTWLMLLAAPRPLVELARHPGPGSDVAQLGRLAPPRIGWYAVFWLITVGCFVGGSAIMLMPLLGH